MVHRFMCWLSRKPDRIDLVICYSIWAVAALIMLAGMWLVSKECR